MINFMKGSQLLNKNIYLPKLAKKVVFSLLVIAGLIFGLFVFSVLAQVDELYKIANINKELGQNTEEHNNDRVVENTLIRNDDKIQVIRTSYHTMTAYNSESGQCDATPCITASGFDLCEHGIEDTVAANFLKFGTKVRIPELFGDKVFIVRDRMNERYQNRVDIWMLSKEEARKFGIKKAKIEILEL